MRLFNKTASISLTISGSAASHGTASKNWRKVMVSTIENVNCDNGTKHLIDLLRYTQTAPTEHCVNANRQAEHRLGNNPCTTPW